jgi:hypothetical protein
MRTLSAFAAFVAFAGCAATPAQAEAPPPPETFAKAEAMIDAFYSFDPARLRAALANAPASQPAILFYQGWAQGGNYAVIERRPCAAGSEETIACPITVRDDLIATLGTDYWVTDTFHLTFENGLLVKVQTSSDDPPEFGHAIEWVRRERPEVMSGPCQGFFAGGPTPQDCVRAMVSGFAAYRVAEMAH